MARAAPFIDSFDYATGPVWGYDVFPDGSFVIALQDGDLVFSDNSATELRVALNWFEELKGRVEIRTARSRGCASLALKRKPQDLRTNPASGLIPVDVHTLDGEKGDLLTEAP